MLGLLQRVTEAWVEVDNKRIAHINQGLMVLVGVQPDDGQAQLQRLCQRLLSYRVFADAQGRMNCSLTDVRGGLLLVPQFTLAADTRKGNRPGFSSAAPPEHASQLFSQLLEYAQSQHPQVAAGRFGADMQVGLVNDGPVTFLLTV